LRPEDLAVGTLTNQQAEFLHGLATAVVEGVVDLKGLRGKPLETLLANLCECRGIGPLGAQLTALTGYGRLACFPTADPALRRWIGRNVHATDEVDGAAAEEWSSQWGDLRGLVALYIYADLLKRGEI
ncbi:MAG: hypothetical protein ACE5KX_09140, partial [Acidimicrobiia bacterium]